MDEPTKLDYSAVANRIRPVSGQATPVRPSQPQGLRPLPNGASDATIEQAHPVVIETIRACERNRTWPLCLWGSTGVGKTCAAAVAYSLWRPSAGWHTLADVCEFLKGFQTAPMQLLRLNRQSSVELSQNGFWQRIERLGLLVIDEIGTRDATAHRYDAFLQILDRRKGKPLILTGNLDPVKSMADVYDQRIQSRIAAGVLLEVRGNDRRMDGIVKRIKVAK